MTRLGCGGGAFYLSLRRSEWESDPLHYFPHTHQTNAASWYCDFLMRLIRFDARPGAKAERRLTLPNDLSGLLRTGVRTFSIICSCFLSHQLASHFTCRLSLFHFTSATKHSYMNFQTRKTLVSDMGSAVKTTCEREATSGYSLHLVFRCNLSVSNPAHQGYTLSPHVSLLVQ